MYDETRTEQLADFFEQHRFHALKTALNDMYEVDVAEFLGELPPDKALVCFRMLKRDVAADVFAELDSDVQEYIINSFSDRELGFIVEELFVDDAVDMLEELPANVVRRVLKVATPETRSLINKFLKYPADSAGSIMTAEYVDLKADMSAEQAIRYIRRTGIDKEQLYVCYVVDSARVLLGVVTLKNLFFADDGETVAQLMDSDVISVCTADDQEFAAAQIRKYGFLSLPVTDAEHRLVGIVTADDAFDVIEEEDSEDFHKMAAMLPSEKEYLKTSAFAMFKNRIVWLLILMVSGMVTGTILAGFQETIATLPLLVTFMPMITGTGGNAGSQSSTLIIRGMAVGEVKTSDWLRVFWKELRVALMVGAALGVVNYVRIILTYSAREGIAMQALVVSVTMLFTVLVAKTIGSLLPILAKKLHLDPAIMAAPLITTVVDAASLMFYFRVEALVLLGGAS